jgi:hypothetical protein
MSFDVEEFVRYQVANVPVRPYPFPHFYVCPVFPDDFYRELLANLPRTEIMETIGEHGTVGHINKETDEFVPGSNDPRYIAELSTLEKDEEDNRRGHLWRDLSVWLLGDAFYELMLQKFRVGIAERFGDGVRLVTDVDARFVRDFHQYKIHPHTDQPTKLVSLLFYLPADLSLSHHGTVIYRPIDPTMRCEGNTRHSFRLFRKVATMPFAPNSLFGFFKTDHSFHGVEEIRDERIERNVLLYNIYVRKVVAQKPREAGRTIWPWARKPRAA